MRRLRVPAAAAGRTRKHGRRRSGKDGGFYRPIVTEITTKGLSRRKVWTEMGCFLEPALADLSELQGGRREPGAAGRRRRSGRNRKENGVAKEKKKNFEGETFLLLFFLRGGTKFFLCVAVIHAWSRD